MATTAATRKMRKKTWNAAPHLSPREKLGLGLDSVAMLFPAAALDDTQGEVKKEKRQREVKDDGAGIHHAAGEVVHLVGQGKTAQQARLPACADGQLVGQEREQEQ